MALYYAHAMPIYGKLEEQEQIACIGRGFNEEIVNPAAYNGHPEKRRDTLAFCFKLIDGCQILVFTRWRGLITSGVGAEVNYALNRGKDVFELIDGKFLPVTEPVKHLSLEETLELYYGKSFRRFT